MQEPLGKDGLTLKEFQERFGIKRIDVDKIKPTGLCTKIDSDKLICPYCGTKNELDTEHYDDVLGGTTWQCHECEKYFYASGDVSIDTYCQPLEDAICGTLIGSAIKSNYDYCDKCEAGGVRWPEYNPYGIVEWEVYKKYVEPLLENMKKRR